MSTPISSEGRAFARQVWREFKRTEPLDATLFAGKPVKSWEEAIFPLFQRCWDQGDPFAQSALKKACDRLLAEPRLERYLIRSGPQIMTVTAHEDHPLTVMKGEHETALIAQMHLFDQGVSGIVVANVSDHALGRYFERCGNRPSLLEGMLFATKMGKVGGLICSTRTLKHSDIFVPLGKGLMAVGNVKNSQQGQLKKSLDWFDCRTVLPEDALSPEERTQANQIEKAIAGAMSINEVNHIPMRPDHVMKVLDAFRKPRH